MLWGRAGAIWASAEAALGEPLFVSLPRLLRWLLHSLWLSTCLCFDPGEVRQSQGPRDGHLRSRCASVFGLPALAPHIHSPARACCGGLLTRPFGSRCLICTISRWLDFLPRQTSVAKIRAGRLLKRFFRFCFANLLRNVVFLSCLHPIHPSLERAKGWSSHDKGLLMLAANSFQINFYIFVTGI